MEFGAMESCPSCQKPFQDGALPGPYCPTCDEYLGSDEDLTSFGFFLATLAGAIGLMVFNFVILPATTLSDAIATVKLDDRAGIEKIQKVSKAGMIRIDPKDGGWSGKVFPGLCLVTFAYEQVKDAQKKDVEARRLAVWWAVDTGSGSSKSVESVDDFTDNHLLDVAYDIIEN